MSAEPASGICTTDIDAAKELAVDLVAVVIESECNIATFLTAIALITGDSVFHLERAGISTSLDSAFVEMRRVAGMHLEDCRRRAHAQSIDCAGTA
jgi:hypothetical protein